MKHIKPIHKKHIKRMMKGIRTETNQKGITNKQNTNTKEWHNNNTYTEEHL